MHHLKEAYIKYILTYFQEIHFYLWSQLKLFVFNKFIQCTNRKIIFDDLGNLSLSGRGASEKPSVEQNNDCFLKWLGQGIKRTSKTFVNHEI